MVSAHETVETTETQAGHSRQGLFIAMLDSTKEYTIGILLLLIVVVLWTVSNFVTQVCYPTLLIDVKPHGEVGLIC